MPKRCLMVAFHYPPNNDSTGVLRTLKFTQYLPRYGWEADVVTVQEGIYQNLDPGMAEQIPARTRVHRTWCIDIAKTVAIRGVYPSWVTIPDRYWLWALPALRRVRRVFADGRAQVLYTTYPLPSAHLVGLLAKRLVGMPWVADFRDPWATGTSRRFRDRVHAWLEARVVATADRVICNTPAMRRWFLAKYPGVDASKFVTITNGYDEADLGAVEPVVSEGFEILYPGSIDEENRNPSHLLEGVVHALEQGWLRRDDLRITFLGAGAYGGSERFAQEVAALGLAGQVEVIAARVPYGQAIRRVAGADCVVLLSEAVGSGPEADEIREWTRLQVPAKLYEYLRLGRPILALVTEGAASELLRSAGGARVVEPADVRAIAESLRDLYAAARSGGGKAAGASGEVVARYSRERLTGLLAETMDALV